MYRLLALLPAAALGMDLAFAPESCDAAPACVADFAGYKQTCCCEDSRHCLENTYNVVSPAFGHLSWTAAARDPVFEQQGMPASRMAILRVPAQGEETEDSLVLVNAIPLCESTLEGLRSVEKQEKVKVRYVVAPGEDPMWMTHLGQYQSAFPEATIYVPPPAGEEETCSGQNFTFTHLDLEEPLAFLHPHLQARYIPGLGRHGKPSNELVFFHKSTDSFVFGDVMWYFSCEPPLDGSLPFSQATLTDGDGPKGRLFFREHEGASTFLDLDAAKDWAKAVTKWPINTLLPLHGNLGGVALVGTRPRPSALVKSALMFDKGPLFEGCAAKAEKEKKLAKRRR